MNKIIFTNQYSVKNHFSVIQVPIYLLKGGLKMAIKRPREKNYNPLYYSWLASPEGWLTTNVSWVIKAWNCHTCGLDTHLSIFPKLKTMKCFLFLFSFLYLIETRPASPTKACGQTSHTWLLSLLLSRSLPRAFFSLVTGCHGFGSHCRLKKWRD